MKRIPIILLLAISLSARAGELVKARLMGDYSNMEADGPEDPHFLAGYNVTLFKHENGTIAQIMVATGGPEPVPARVERLKYDQNTRRLTFSAQYSAGLISNPGKGRVDYEDLQLLTFRGVVYRNSISGEMSTRPLTCGHCRSTTRHIRLRRLKDIGPRDQLWEIPK